MQNEEIEKLERKIERQALCAFNRAAKALKQESVRLQTPAAKFEDAQYKDAVTSLINVYLISGTALSQAAFAVIGNKMVDTILGEVKALPRTPVMHSRKQRMEGIEEMITTVAPQNHASLSGQSTDKSSLDVRAVFAAAVFDLLSLATKPNKIAPNERAATTKQAKKLLALSERA